MIDYIKSVLHPESTRYCRVDGWYDSGLLVWSYGQFDTYGDGDTKHSPSYRLGASAFTDFCLSMAQFILDNPDESIREYEFGLDKVRKPLFDFLQSVKYDENRRKWFSITLSKVSTSDSKRYDKRWSEVPSWADGSVKAAFDLFWFCRESRGHLLERYAILQQFREHAGGSFFEEDKCEVWREELTGDHLQAFRALQSAVDAAQARDWSKRLIQSAVYNSKPKEQAVAA